MELRELPDKTWNAHEKKRFLKDATKASTEEFDPDEFEHEGFEDRQRFVDEYVPSLAAEERLRAELDEFRPPRLNSMNDSSYQALVIRYGVLRTLIKQLNYKMTKQELLEGVQSWQKGIIDNFDEDGFDEDDDLLHLARAGVDYKSELNDSELHMIHSYFRLHNKSEERRHHYYTWLDFFKRLASIDRFPKISRSDKPEHALDTIKQGVWSLQEQAILYEVKDKDGNDVVGIPEDYIPFIRDWLDYEMSYDNYLNMLEEIEYFDSQSRLLEAANKFDVETARSNQERRENIARAGVSPTELLSELLTNDELQEVIDKFGLEANRRRNSDMIDKIIEYFEHSQKYADMDTDGPTIDLYLSSFEEISDGNIERVPPQLQGEVPDEEDTAKRLDMLFEEATAEIFNEAFNLDGTYLKGYTASGTVPDGEVEQDGSWLLWDNKRRSGGFHLDSDTRSKIKNYIDTKNQQHDVEWFLIIAPEFSSNTEKEATKLETQTGIDIRMITASDFRSLAEFWSEKFAEDGRELPLSVFYGGDVIDLEPVKESLEEMFS
jgi:hypothetical protein